MRSHCVNRRYPPPARTYYVDASGGGSNSGNSEHAALQTIAHVNALKLKPGDRVLFKRGETWSGTTLTPPESGVAGRHILFGDYGTGTLPSITGPSGTSTIILTGKRFITLKNLTINAEASAGQRAVFGGASTNDILVENCFGYKGLYGVFSFKEPTTYRIFIVSCTATQGSEQGITFDSNVAGYGVIEGLISDCVAYENGTNSSAHHGIYLKYARECTVRRCTSYNNAGAGVKLNSCLNNIVECNYLYSDAGTRSRYGFFMDIESPPAVCQGNIVRNNLINGCIYGLVVNSNVNVANYYYHNTIVVSTGKGVMLYATVANQVFKNNIVRQDADVHGTYDCAYYVYMSGNAPVNTNTFDYNCITYDNDTTRVAENDSGTRWSFEQWQALTGNPDVHSISVDPKFVAEYTDMRLQATSPCIGAGDSSVGVMTDKNGVPRGATVDIGCYEYVA